MKFRSIIIVICIIITGLIPSAVFARNTRLDYVKKQVSAKTGTSKPVAKLFADKRLRVFPIAKVAYKQPDWVSLEASLLSSSSLAYGKNFLDDNKQYFDRAEAEYNVSKESLAGLIAIETNFGRNTGSYVAMNAIYSRMMHSSSTAWKSHAAQLIALSDYCISAKLDCYKIKGSYAGAIGLVQFMPLSIQTYGIDGDNDNRIDLFKPVDAIPSAANFLAHHGWSDDQHKALGAYYGSPVGYPDIVLKFAEAIKN